MELVASPPPETHSFFSRIVGAALLRPEIYDEIKRDPNATYQGAVVVMLAGAASAVWRTVDNPIWVALIFTNLISWLVSTTILFTFAKYLLTPRTTWGMADWLLRTSAFATAPQMLVFFTPYLIWWQGALLQFGIAVWAWIATILAIRQGLQISTGRALWVWFGTALILSVVAGVAFIAVFGLVVSAWT
jgi:hypothetical protein